MKTKRLQTALLIGLIFTVFASFLSFETHCQEIREKVLRLHIIANSDSEEDQELKLKVRDSLLEESEGLFDKVMNESQAAEQARASLPVLKRIAEAEIAKQGFDYPVSVEVTMTDFSTRYYENVTLPAGRYEALRVIIGEGKGQNWWCVMFPSMCLPAARESAKLDEVLGESEMDIVENSAKYEFRFKTVEVFQSLKKEFSKMF